MGWWSPVFLNLCHTLSIVLILTLSHMDMVFRFSLRCIARTMFSLVLSSVALISNNCLKKHTQPKYINYQCKIKLLYEAFAECDLAYL